MKTHWLPAADYGEILTRQEKQRAGIIAGLESECILMVEHQSCVTLGKRGGEIMMDRLHKGTTIHQINRGGLATWHGPGQLVLYPIINLRRRKLGVRSFVCGLEGAALEFLAQHSLSAQRRKNLPGLWLQEKKIASIGLEIKRGITTHGLSVNISNTLEGFQAIQPCGIANVSMTSMQEHLLSTPSIKDAGLQLTQIFLTWLNDNSMSNY